MKNPRCVFVFLAVMGLAGLALGAGCGSDAAPAAVPDPISVNTLDGGEGVPVDSTFKYVFSRPMITSAVTKSTFFIVKNEVSSSLNKAVVDGGICDSTQALDVSVGCSSPAECTLTPAELLEYSTTYSICLTGNMQYATGEQFGSFMATFTAEAEGPLDLNNLDGAVDVPVDSSFRYRFLKEVDTSTVDTSTYFIVPTPAAESASISKADIDSTICDSANAVASEITCTRWSCTIAPSEYLEYITGYTACLASNISYTSSFEFNGFMASFTTGDLSSPTNLGLSVVNRRAAQIELSWDSSSDIPSEWENVRQAEVRCVEDEPITMANWDTAMQFADDPISGASPINWTMLVAEDINGNKIRAGHDYYCGIRGESVIDNQWSSLMTFGVISQSDIAFQQYATVIEGYTRIDYYWLYYSSVEAAGDVNGDNYDDLLVGFGVGSNDSKPGYAAAVYFGSADGPSESNKLDITCTDDTFGGAMVGIGDFDNDSYPDIASGVGGSDKVYIFRGHAGLGSSALDCADADITIIGPPGSGVGNYFGNTIAAAGDFDGDGYKDIAISAPCYNSFGGAVWIVFGRSEASYPVTIDLNSGANADGALFISGLSNAASMGIAAGDLDKDGYWDLVFTTVSGGASGYGDVQVLNGYSVTKTPDTVTTLTPADLDQVVDFAGPSDNWSGLGKRAVSILDFDSDGCPDVAVGAYQGEVGSGAEEKAGNVLVYRGQASGVTCTGLLGTTPYAVTYGSTADDQLGFVTASGMNMSLADPEPWRINGLLTSASDVTLLAGAWQAMAGGPGYVALWYGGFTGNLSSSQADVTFAGVSGAVSFHWVNYVGDLDGDGYVDIAIGDTEYGTDGRIVIYH